MPFLTLNGTTYRIQSNGMGQKYNEHGTDRFRTFSGDYRFTRRGIYREWNGNTAILSYSDAASLIAVLTTTPQPLVLTGDLVGDETVAVMPILISNDPIHTASGHMRRVVFTLHETPAALPADTSAPVFRFYRRGMGLWQDWDGTTPAVLGDYVGRWDDQMNPGDFFLAGGVNGNFPPPVFGIDNSLAPIRGTNGVDFGDQGYFVFAEAGFTGGDGDIDALDGTGCEIMIGVKLNVFPTVIASTAGLWHTRWGGAVGGNSPGPSAFVYFPHPNGNIYEHFALTDTINLGTPVADLDSLVCYNIVALQNGVDANEYTVRINDIEQYTSSPSDGAIQLDASHFWSFSNNPGTGEPALNGTIRDIVINAGRFTPAQRASWRDYILGVTDEPPIPE